MDVPLRNGKVKTTLFPLFIHLLFINDFYLFNMFIIYLFPSFFLIEIIYYMIFYLLFINLIQQQGSSGET